MKQHRRRYYLKSILKSKGIKVSYKHKTIYIKHDETAPVQIKKLQSEFNYVIRLEI
jgi:hypothetical protein